jgi:putative zinc-binding metallo-peptidase
MVIAGSLTGFGPASWITKSLTREPGSRPATVQGIAIHYQYDRRRFFPSAWLADPIDCGGAQLDASEAERAVPLIEEFAGSYNPTTLHANLTDIYLVSELHCYGEPYGGTNSTSSLYIRVGKRAEGYTNQVVLATLHEEFSSILFRKYTFPKQAWQQIAGDDYEYPEDWVEVLGQEGLMVEPPAGFLARGFLSRYSETSMENDFNEYAGWIFVWPDWLCEYASRYPAIEHKARLAVEFYHSIDPEVGEWNCE